MSSRETVAFSEDAAYLAVALKDGQVKVWDTAKRRLTQTFSPVIAGKSPISCLAWSKEVQTRHRVFCFVLLRTTHIYKFYRSGCKANSGSCFWPWARAV